MEIPSCRGLGVLCRGHAQHPFFYAHRSKAFFHRLRPLPYGRGSSILVFCEMKLLKLLLIAFGILILYITVQKVGLQSIAENFSPLGWKLLLLLFFFPFVFAFDTLGWSY